MLKIGNDRHIDRQKERQKDTRQYTKTIHNLQWNPEVRKIVAVGGNKPSLTREGNAVLVPGVCFSNVPVTFQARKAVLYFRVYI